MGVIHSSPQSDTATADLARLRDLVEEHQGNRSAIARALSDGGRPITRQGLSAQLGRFGLLDLADELSAQTNKPGPRNNVPRAVVRAERERVLEALAGVATYDDAAPVLGVSVATMYRTIKRHRITKRMVANRRKLQIARAAKKPRTRRAK